jgi:hypothetical protein
MTSEEKLLRIAVGRHHSSTVARRAGFYELPRIDVERWREVGDRVRREAMPLVIAGAVAESTAVRDWSPRGLARRFDMTVQAALDFPVERAPYLDKANAHVAEIPFSELVNRIERGESCYLAQAALERFEGLLGEIDLSATMGVPPRAMNLWVGGQIVGGLHFDTPDNFLVQIYGRKRAVLVAPKHVRALRVLPDIPEKSGLSPEEIESEGDGPLSRIERWRTTLDPGDALYIPRGWWHHLTTPGVSISINAWHGDVLTVKDKLAFIFRVGPRVWGRTARDFVWCGMLRRPYRQRLFAPLPLGVQLAHLIIGKNRLGLADQRRPHQPGAPGHGE